MVWGDSALAALRHFALREVVGQFAELRRKGLKLGIAACTRKYCRWVSSSLCTCLHAECACAHAHVRVHSWNVFPACFTHGCTQLRTFPLTRIQTCTCSKSYTKPTHAATYIPESALNSAPSSPASSIKHSSASFIRSHMPARCRCCCVDWSYTSTTRTHCHHQVLPFSLQPLTCW